MPFPALPVLPEAERGNKGAHLWKFAKQVLVVVSVGKPSLSGGAVSQRRDSSALLAPRSWQPDGQTENVIADSSADFGAPSDSWFVPKLLYYPQNALIRPVLGP